MKKAINIKIKFPYKNPITPKIKTMTLLTDTAILVAVKKSFFLAIKALKTLPPSLGKAGI